MRDGDEARVRQVLDVALRLGQLLLSCQSGTADVASTIMAVTDAYGLPATHVDIAANAITVSIPRAVPGAPVTAMYVVASRALDYTRLQSATDLAQRVVDTTPELDWVQEQLDALERAEHPYPSWVCTVALGVMAGGFSLLFGAGALAVVIATATTALIDRVGRILGRRHLPSLFQQVVAAALATGVTVGLDAAHRLPATTAPSVVVASNIVALLSGLTSVGSVQDAITGYQLTAASRMMDVALSSAGILVGVTIALRIGMAAGVDVSVSPDLQIAPLRLPVVIAAGAVGAAGAAVASYAPRRAALAAGAAGATGSLIYFVMQLLGAGVIVDSFVAAAAIGMAGSVGARRARVPPLVIVTAGIIPLVPGMALYRSFVGMVNGQPNAGAGDLVVAAGTALALGAGVVLGPLLAPSIRREVARYRPRIHAGAKQHTVSRYPMPLLAGIRYAARGSIRAGSRDPDPG
ncbi:threonine/serine ThrE exporter family protein [Mycobacterium sp. Lab-001]|uniref:threonine/serine ThrE exporter family protein n=1 Tax=Mycobacterium sp. Lab-001 TaxID=3410136 RepID=UPI003D16CAAB